MRFLYFVLEIIYSLLLVILLLTFWPLFLFSASLREQLLARKKGYEGVLAALKENPHRKRLIFFVSSAGEYEQAKPVLSRLAGDLGVQAFLIFNSLAGYKFAQTRQESIPHMIAPIDFPFLWHRIFRELKPCICVLIRHDLLPGFGLALKSYCPLWILNASDKKKPGIGRQALASVASLFSQRVFSVAEVGDTKFDRVAERRREQVQDFRFVKNVLGDLSDGRKILIIGSAWAADVELVVGAFKRWPESQRQKWLLLIAPHDLSPDNFDKLSGVLQREGFNNPILNLHKGHPSTSDYSGEPICLLRSMGLLAEMYGAADLAFVGGSVDRKIHNVLEPLSYGVPMACGPHYESQHEAIDLVERGLMKVVRSSEELYLWWQDATHQNLVRERIPAYLDTKLGAAEQVYKILRNFLIKSDHAL